MTWVTKLRAEQIKLSHLRPEDADLERPELRLGAIRMPNVIKVLGSILSGHFEDDVATSARFDRQQE